MSSLSAIAEQLRSVQQAQERFLALFALECIWSQPHPYERLARDLASLDSPGESDGPRGQRLADR